MLVGDRRLPSRGGCGGPGRPDLGLDFAGAAKHEAVVLGARPTASPAVMGAAAGTINYEIVTG